MNTALITGIRGQDACMLTKLLVDHGYTVYGIDRRSGEASYWRLREEGVLDSVSVIYADLTEYHAVKRALEQVRPDLLFNLAAQSFVQASFNNPFTTLNVNTIGLMNILEAVRELKLGTRIYQASTSELFGKPLQVPQSETTPFYPRSPYGVSKLAAHWMAVNYREAYNMFCSCGILFNHESEYRGEEFLTRKVTKGVAEFVTGKRTEPIQVGNLESCRDWGYARDYVEAMYLMLTADSPEDFVIATGKTYSVKDFITLAFAAGNIPIEWGEDEGLPVAVNAQHGIVVRTSPEFYRPAEVDLLLGDPAKARERLGWSASHSLEELIDIMVSKDIARLKMEERRCH